MIARKLAAGVLGALTIGGCAVLRVDVDIYKGPLADRIEVQWQEFAELAVAAKPLLAFLRNAYEETDPRSKKKECKNFEMPAAVDCDFANPFAKRVNALLSLYQDSTELEKFTAGRLLGFEKARQASGIETLTTAYIKSISDKKEGLSSVTRSMRRSAETDIYQAFLPLQTALVSFANKMLVIANNQAIIDNLPESMRSTAANAPTSSYVALLQGIGNNLLSLANELHTREAFKRQNTDRAGAEQAAMEDAFQDQAAKVIGNLLLDIKGQISAAVNQGAKVSVQTKTDQSAAESSKIKADAAKKETGLAEEKATNAATELTQYADKARPVLNAYRLASGKVDVIKGVDAVDVTAAVRETLIADGKSLAAAMSKVTDATPEKVRQAAIAWLKAELDKYSQVTQDAPRARFLRAASEHLNGATVQFAAFSDQPKAAAGEVLREAMRVDFEAAFNKAELLFKASSAAQSALNVARASQKAAEDLAGRGTQKVATDKETGDQNKTDVQKLQDAADAIVAAWGESYATFTAGGSPPEGRSVLVTLRAALDAKRQAAGSDEKVRARFANAISVIDGYAARQAKAGSKPWQDAARSTSDADAAARDRRDILDGMTAALRYQLLQAESVGETARAAMLRRALDVANDQRGGMAYFRPPSAYLRSANAATTLQEQSPTQWVNMLYQYSLRAWTPSFLDKPTADDNTRAELDKQNWQSINTVFVKGGGNTNYVLAKDDIGNWYVKAYETDPGPIIRSAQGLALFNLGRNLNVNLLRNANLHAQIDNETDEAKKTDLRKQLTTGQTSPADNNALKRVLDRYKEQYNGSTTDSFTRLKQDLKSGRPLNGIREKWAARGDLLKDAIAEGDKPGELTTALKVQAAALGTVEAQRLAPVSATSSRPKVELESEAIWQALRAIVQSRKELVGSIDSSTTLSTDAKKSAREDVISSYNAFAKETVDSRQEAIKQFETSVVLIGDVTGQANGK